MPPYNDLGEWALYTLKNTAAVTALVYAGADAIVESGDVSNADLEAWQAARRNAGITNKVLAVFVMDTGESDSRIASCMVFVYDRGASYANIRATREAVISALVGQPVALPRDAYIVSVDYSARTGHAIDQDFDLDFERVLFSANVLGREPDLYA